jgi:Ca2+-binding EF-hand superfamily protein
MKPLLAIATVALLSSTAFAQNATPPSLSSAFDALDADKDSKINRQESQSSPVVAQSFAQADANSDGALTREEFMSSFTMGGGNSAPPGASREAPPASSPPPR